jgi:hypothetical protein
MANQALGSGCKAKQKLLARLTKHGITIEDISSMGMLYKLDLLRQIDQMCDNRANPLLLPCPSAILSRPAAPATTPSAGP